MQDLQNSNQEPNCSQVPAGTRTDSAGTDLSANAQRAAGTGTGRRAYGQHMLLKGVAGRAETNAVGARQAAQRFVNGQDAFGSAKAGQSYTQSGQDTLNHDIAGESHQANGLEKHAQPATPIADIDAILAGQSSTSSHLPANSSGTEHSPNTTGGLHAAQNVHEQNLDADAAQQVSTRSDRSVPADTSRAVKVGSEGAKTGSKRKKQMSQSAKGANGKAGKHTGGKNGKKKPKSGYTFKDILKIYIPWRGDSVSEAVRKIVFFSALSVVGVCTFLISNYYIDLYKARAEYEAMQAEVEAARARRGFDDDESTEETKIGETIEYLDYNYVADRFLSQNPDLVGYVKIPNTLVSYPVVQKKSKDPNENTNDYYLYRTFHQEQSKSGCIFMDFRCHFDEVAEHRRVVKNSDNIVIYGHNMNNQTMFGSLRNYINNPYYYMDHPVVEFDSCYENYDYKIFAVFVVSGDDFDSEYSFDCWNDIDFKDEDAFYEYVNNAKKRTMINTNVDVQYGDPILTLYTCNGLVKNAKLILTCRRVRPHEDLESGTQDATLNDNVLYPKEYYDYGHPMNFDASRFVPYGPSDS